MLTMMLNDIGLETVGLHGMISQRQRLAALSQFKSNVVKILVATDVASRGMLVFFFFFFNIYLFIDRFNLQSKC